MPHAMAAVSVAQCHANFVFLERVGNLRYSKRGSTQGHGATLRVLGNLSEILPKTFHALSLTGAGITAQNDIDLACVHAQQLLAEKRKTRSDFDAAFDDDFVEEAAVAPPLATQEREARAIHHSSGEAAPHRATAVQPRPQTTQAECKRCSASSAASHPPA
jgi:hypothetical protein